MGLARSPDVIRYIRVGWDGSMRLQRTFSGFPSGWAGRHALDRLGIEPDVIDGGHYISLCRPLELETRLAAYASQTR